MGTGGNFFPATENGAEMGAENVSGDGNEDYTPVPDPPRCHPLACPVYFPLVIHFPCFELLQSTRGGEGELAL